MKRITYITALLVLILTTNTYGQFWQQTNGPGGDNVRDIAVNSNGHIFVVSRGVHRSTDNGVTWQQIFVQSPLWNFSQIIIQPSGKIFLVGETTQKGVFSSIDNGNSWQQVQPGLGTLFQGAHQEIFSQNSLDSNKVVRSTDDGLTWKTINTTGVSGNRTWITSDTGKRLFICADFLYRSTDDGNSWSKIVNGLPPKIGRIAESPTGTLYSFVYGNEILYKSNDGGRTWQTVTINIDQVDQIRLRLLDIAFTSSGNITITTDDYLSLSTDTVSRRSICVSTDNGLNWKNVSSDFKWSIALPRVIVTEPSNTLLISCLIGILRYDPITNTRTELSLPNSTVTAIAAHPNGSIITVTQSGKAAHIEDNLPYVWNSTTDGSTWERALDNRSFSKLNYNPTAIPLCLDSSQNVISNSNGYVVSSSNAGSNWKRKIPDLTTGYISSIAVRFDGSIFAASSNEGIFRSTDNGVTWDQLNAGIADQKLFCVAVHQNGDVYAGAKNAIFKSTDMGISWQKLVTNFPPAAQAVRALVVSTQGNIIAGIDSVGVYWSTNNGATWGERATGLPTKSINALLSTPIGKVFAATTNGIYFLDTASTATWQNHSGGLTSMNVLSLCRDANGRLFAGTEASGVFSSVQTFNIIAPEAVKQTSDKASSPSLGTLYPNPSSSKVTIPFSVSERTQVEITVVDILGNTLGIIENEVLHKGTYETSLTTSELPNGTYAIILKAGDMAFTKQFVVAK